MNNKECQHPACSCAPANGSDYCSSTCEDAKDTPELACQCQHPGCRAEPLKH